MNLEAGGQKISEQSIKQVELDSFLALEKARFRLELSDVTLLRCVSVKEETEDSFGQQLWFFDAVGMHTKMGSVNCFGVLHYRVEYGLLELMQTHVFDSENERRQYKRFSKTGKRTDRFWHPANCWLIGGLAAVGMVWLMYLSFLMAR